MKHRGREESSALGGELRAAFLAVGRKQVSRGPGLAGGTGVGHTPPEPRKADCLMVLALRGCWFMGYLEKSYHISDE